MDMMRSWSCRSGKDDVIRLGAGGPTNQYDVTAAGFSRCRGAAKRVTAAWNSLVRGTGLAQRQRRGYYDAYTYALNFEEGAVWDEEEEVEILCRSFSMRYANPSSSRFYRTRS